MYSCMHALRTMHVPTGAGQPCTCRFGSLLGGTPSKPVGVVSLHESRYMGCMGIGTLAGLGRWSELKGCPAGGGDLLELLYMAGTCTRLADLSKAEKGLDVAEYTTNAYFTPNQARICTVNGRAQP